MPNTSEEVASTITQILKSILTSCAVEPHGILKVLPLILSLVYNFLTYITSIYFEDVDQGTLVKRDFAGALRLKGITVIICYYLSTGWHSM